MATKYTAVEIDGKKIHCPSAGGVSITRNLIQSANTRRTAKGNMTGKVVAVKATVSMSFPPGMDPSEIKKIKDIVTSLQFKHTLKLVDETSTVTTLKVYFGSYSAEQYGFINGKMLLQSLSFEAVEI